MGQTLSEPVVEKVIHRPCYVAPLSSHTHLTTSMSLKRLQALIHLQQCF